MTNQQEEAKGMIRLRVAVNEIGWEAYLVQVPSVFVYGTTPEQAVYRLVQKLGMLIGATNEPPQ